MSQLYFPASAEISLVCVIRILYLIVQRGNRRLHVFFTDSESRVRGNRMHGLMREDWQVNHGTAI
jgi:DUF2075 family protein